MISTDCIRHSEQELKNWFGIRRAPRPGLHRRSDPEAAGRDRDAYAKSEDERCDWSLGIQGNLCLTAALSRVMLPSPRIASRSTVEGEGGLEGAQVMTSARPANRPVDRDPT